MICRMIAFLRRLFRRQPDPAPVYDVCEWCGVVKCPVCGSVTDLACPNGHCAVCHAYVPDPVHALNWCSVCGRTTCCRHLDDNYVCSRCATKTTGDEA